MSLLVLFCWFLNILSCQRACVYLLLLWNKWLLLSIVVLTMMIIFWTDLSVIRSLCIYLLLRLDIIFPYDFVKNSLFIDLITLNFLCTDNSVILSVQIVISTLIVITWWVRVCIVVKMSLLIILVVLNLVNVRICVINEVRIFCTFFGLVWINNMSVLYFNTTFSNDITFISQEQMIRNVVGFSSNLIW